MFSSNYLARMPRRSSSIALACTPPVLQVQCALLHACSQTSFELLHVDLQDGEGEASPGGVGEASSGTQGGDRNDSSSNNSGDNSGSQERGKHEPDHTYEDGSLLFTAESLAKVSFNELEP